ncbi:MAG: dinitrogenase iron-molybdenum cofactor [Thermococci archaeon]|nr:dinitrogenase iron-molybdenum cofactor [Thermococci archaeon]
MRIGVPVETNEGLESRVSRHFGRARYLAIADLTGDNFGEVRFVELPESHGPGELPSLAAREGVDVVVAYGIGGRALAAFSELGIDVITGVDGTLGDVLRGLAEGRIESDPGWAEVIKREKSHD